VTVARHRRSVLGVCALILIACLAAYPALQRAIGVPSYAVKNSQSARVEQLVEQLFPGLGNEDDVVAFTSTQHIASDPTYRAVITAVDRTLRPRRDVGSVVDPYDLTAVGQILSGEHVALTLVTLRGGANQRYMNIRSLQTAVTRAVGDSGIQAWLVGLSPILKDLSDVQKTETEHAEAIGLPAAFVILLLTLGAVVAAMLPLLLAIAGLVLTYGALAALALVFHFDGLLVAVVTIIGLGIGIDYSLFIVSRFHEELTSTTTEERDESERVADAVGVALATSGRTIMFSGVVVALSMGALLAMNSEVYREIAVGAVIAVMCMLVVSMTLLPATLALLGAGIDRGALPWRRRSAVARSAAGGGRRGGWSAWALLIMRRPVLVASTVGVLLLVATVSVFHLRLGVSADVLQNPSTTSGKGERVLAQAVSPGAVSPIQVVVAGAGVRGHGNGAQVAAATSLNEAMERDNRVTGVVERRGGAGVLLTVIPAVPIDSTAATRLVRYIRNDLAPPLEAHGRVAVFVGGSTARAMDASDELVAKLPLLLVLILGSSLLFLLVIFRSVVLPVKAVLMNLLATGATMGLVVWVFQDAHGQQLLNFTSKGFIQVTVPVITFALLFGLSMDYEIFLIRRVREEWRKTGDNTLAVATGIERTARPITAAAAIMVVVFGSFMAAGLLELKQIGFALAAAIALDATLIRLVLVPATMRLLGERNWWLPAWLERVLPDIGVD